MALRELLVGEIVWLQIHTLLRFMNPWIYTQTGKKQQQQQIHTYPEGRYLR